MEKAKEIINCCIEEAEEFGDIELYPNVSKTIEFGREAIAELTEAEKQIADLRKEVSLLKEEMDTRNMASSKALDELWKEIILKSKPSYGDWEYPAQAQRHLIEEFNDLKAERDTLDRKLNERR